MKTRRIILITILMANLLAGGCISSDKVVRDVRKYGSFKGIYAFPLDMDSMRIVELEPIVIRNQAQFLHFKQGIPPFEMTKTSPAPVNDDPMLKLDSIDWSAKMILVIFSHEDNSFIELIINEVKMEEEVMVATAHYRYPEPMEIYQKVTEFGLYYALIVDRFDGEVNFETIIDH